jgi:hypothetical protein
VMVPVTTTALSLRTVRSRRGIVVDSFTEQHYTVQCNF